MRLVTYLLSLQIDGGAWKREDRRRQDRRRREKHVPAGRAGEQT